RYERAALSTASKQHSSNHFLFESGTSVIDVTSGMLKKERYRAFVDYFSAHNPDAQTELNYSNPFELLVAVILSAQCTDKRINQVTPALFRRFPDVESLAASS